MSSKKLASALAAALALATAGAHAQDGFLNTLGKSLLKTAQEAGTATKRPPGILGAYYWDDGDPQVLDGYTRLRWGLTATLDAGALTCEELLFAQEKAGQPMTASTRERCLGTWNTISARAGQKGGGEGAFEARRREIAAADRFYLRPRIQTTIGNDGVLHAYVYLLSESWYPDSPGSFHAPLCAVIGAGFTIFRTVANTMRPFAFRRPMRKTFNAPGETWRVTESFSGS